MNAGWRCTSERHQILHTGSLRWLWSCFTAWLHIFLEFQTSMFFVPENHRLQRSGPTSTRNSLCSARFGQHMARLRQIIGNTTWFAQTHHVTGTGASCMLKFSNFCHHIRSKQAGPRRNFTPLTHELVREWATRSLTRRFGLPLTTTKRLLRKLRSSVARRLVCVSFSCLLALHLKVHAVSPWRYRALLRKFVLPGSAGCNPALPRKAVVLSTNHDRPRRSEETITEHPIDTP